MWAEHRQLKDRRSSPTGCLGRYTLTGRRKIARRNSESVNYYVDRYERRYLLMIGLILVLGILDCGLSLKIHQWGGSEINLLAAGLIKNSPILLLFIKLGLTSIGLTFLLFHKNFKVFGVLRAGDVIYFILAVYLVLNFYQLYAVLSINKIMTVS
jgi:hypothetical protein